MNAFGVALAVVTSGCTVGSAARFEGTLDRQGHAHATFDVEGDVGVTQLPNEVGVARERSVELLFSVGLGWGDGLRLTTGVDLFAVPSPEQLAGVTAGLHVSSESRCLGVRFGLGVVGLLAQTRADDNIAPLGPNPRLTRYYHSLAAIAGTAACDGPDLGTSTQFGLAYTVGVAALVVTPGP